MDRVFFAEGNLATFTPSVNNWCFSEQKNAPHIVLYSDSIGSNGNIYNAQPTVLRVFFLIHIPLNHSSAHPLKLYAE